MSISNNYSEILPKITQYNARLVAVSKMQPLDAVKELYQSGQRHFGENKVQSLLQRFDDLPKDISWHLLGHLQTNKVKQIVPFIHLIHSVDSLKLVEEINKQAEKINRKVSILLQIYIAKEESKFGLDIEEAKQILLLANNYPFVDIVGLMGMATNTTDESIIKNEFLSLKAFYDECIDSQLVNLSTFNTLSMGMSSDYPLALQCGSNLVRIGSALFGERNYDKIIH
jgi:pyridoxal phosphate enzyme (YggS family)